MQDYLKALKGQVADKRHEQEQARSELKEVQAALTELREQVACALCTNDICDAC